MSNLSERHLKTQLLFVSKICTRWMYFTNDKNEQKSLNSYVWTVISLVKLRVFDRPELWLSSVLSFYKANCYKANKTSDFYSSWFYSGWHIRQVQKSQ